MAPRVALLALLVAVPAFAQTASLSSLDGSRGLALPATSAAFSDDAATLGVNPAGLGRAGAFSLVYAHEASPFRGLEGDGLSLASALGELAGAGFSMESLRWAGRRPSGRTAFGLSFGPQALSLGAALTWHLGIPGQGTPVGLDVGLQSRPLRALSLAATLRNANDPGTTDWRPGREYDFAVGLRPVGDRLTLGVDFLLPERAGFDAARLQYTAGARLVDGLRLQLGVAHGLSAAQPLALQLGLALDLGNVGVTLGAHQVDGQSGWQVVARYASDSSPALAASPKLAVIGLGGLGSEPGATLGALLGLEAEDRYLRTLRALEAAARDPLLAGLVLKIETANLGLARADELRQAIVRLRAAGKPVFAYLLSAGDAEYLVASACDAIYAAPESMFLVDGLKSSVTFVGEAAEALGIQVDVARVGAFKNFPDQFTRKDMSPEHHEALSAYLDTAARALEQRVATARHLTPAAWRASVDEGLKSTRRAQELGQLDGLLTPREFDELLRTRLPGAVVDRHYRPWPERDERWGDPTRIAVVPVLGNIAGGKNQVSPLGGDAVAGAESFITAMAEAAEDPSVAAIVVRIDSGGGDGLASYLMEQAVIEARKKKPVVASMGDVAASGGYYVACAADQIFASPTTLTGSIGVFFAKPSLQGLGEKYGVRQVSLSRGRLAGITDVWEPWSDEQRAAAQKWVDDFYDTFLAEVARGRHRTKAEIDAVARGRIWSGEDAQAHGLVDTMGGLIDAIQAARRRAHVPDTNDDVEIVFYGVRRGLGPSLLSAAVPTALAETPAPAAGPLPPPWDTLATRLGPWAWLLGAPGVQARLEFDVRLR